MKPTDLMHFVVKLQDVMQQKLNMFSFSTVHALTFEGVRSCDMVKPLLCRRVLSDWNKKNYNISNGGCQADDLLVKKHRITILKNQISYIARVPCQTLVI